MVQIIAPIVNHFLITIYFLADRSGFEPEKRSLPYPLSRRALSSTQPSVHFAALPVYLIGKTSRLLQSSSSIQRGKLKLVILGRFRLVGCKWPAGLIVEQYEKSLIIMDQVFDSDFEREVKRMERG